MLSRGCVIMGDQGNVLAELELGLRSDNFD